MTRMDRKQVVQAVEALGVVAVIRLKEPERLRSVIDALAEGGIKALEITMTVPGAIDLIRALAPTLPADFIIGAGTVLDAETATAAVNAGAQFVVSPVCRASVIKATQDAGAAAMPGCFTPTEILNAWDAGADVVKVFPATSLGPQFFKDVRGPLPHVKMMPTGGVSLDNAGQWIAAGAVAVGVGTSLLDSKAIAAGNYGVLTTNARLIVANVAAAREALR